MSILLDLTHELVYVPMSRTLWGALHEWSKPCQLRIEGDMLVVRDLEQPVKGVYIVAEDSNTEREP